MLAKAVQQLEGYSAKNVSTISDQETPKALGKSGYGKSRTSLETRLAVGTL